MPEHIGALEARVTALENAVNNGLMKIESLIRQEIQDLKTEQLRDIKTSIERIERDVKEENKRLADDQRRLWDAVRNLENARNFSAGAGRAKTSIAHGFTGLLSGAGGAFLTWLLTRGGSH